MKVIQQDGRWLVVDDAGRVLADCATNSEAWRAADRLDREPETRREAVVDWLWHKRLDGD